jgi:hypothetical protein
MPWSWDLADSAVKTYISQNFSKEAEILDLGAGMGKWGKYLKEMGYTKVDALEFWAPYVIEYGIKDIYREVFVGDMRYFRFDAKYRLLTAGDVFEHLSVVEAKKFLEKVQTTLIVIVPWKMGQWTNEGNTMENHLQPDLTPEVMKERYPSLVPLSLEKLGGAYIQLEKGKR